MLRRLDPEIIRAEVIMQIAAFRDLFGRAPDFVDGHQHVQLYPQVRDGLLAAVKEKAPEAWVRQARRNLPLGAANGETQGALPRSSQRAVQTQGARGPALPSIPPFPAPMIIHAAPTTAR